MSLKMKIATSLVACSVLLAGVAPSMSFASESSLDKVKIDNPENMQELQLQLNVLEQESLEVSETISQELLDILTIEDYVNAYSILESTGILEDLSIPIEEKNQLSRNAMIEAAQFRVQNAVSGGISTLNVADQIKRLYGSITTQEMLLIGNYPTEALVYYNKSVTAINRAAALYTDASSDGNGDAFRHAYWNAILARGLIFVIGQNTISNASQRAKVWTDAHEVGQTGLSTTMDSLNNSRGRSLFETNGYTISEAQYETIVKKAVGAGNLYRFAPSRTYIIATDNSTLR